MSRKRALEAPAVLRARNVGGIDETEVQLSQDVNVLVGRNATNRTSLLEALMAALGSKHTSLKGDAEEGHVELTIGSDTYERTLVRTETGVSTKGDPYLDGDEADVADLFAFLIESNEARRAVAQGGDLREIIMRPIDTDAIQNEIEALETEKRELDNEIEELDVLEAKLPDLESRKNRLEREIEETREELQNVEAEIEAADADVNERAEEQSELNAKLEELRETRSELENVRLDVESEQKSIDALKSQRSELKADLEDATLPDMDVDEIENEIEGLRSRRQELDVTLGELQSVIQFNEEMLEGTTSEIANALRDKQDSGSVTDQLVADEQVICWTCGTEVETAKIESTLERMRDLRTEKVQERNNLEEEIGDLEGKKREYEESRREQTRLKRQLEETDEELTDRKASIEDLRERREAIQDEIADLEETVEELEENEQSDLLERHREANELEFELGRLESDREDVEAEIESIESQLDDREGLTDRRSKVTDELTDLRSRIEQIEIEAVDQFNEHVETVLDLLDYANLDRIWIERTEQEVREGRRKVTRSSFDLHVIRRTPDGTTYEDSVDHLSESEREVVGLMFGLAGYLVHNVYETLPFILLDSLEAIDAQRIATLVDYLQEYADYLTVALLPEDAAALDDSYPRISNI